MKRTILYYPTINIPSKAWLYNALIYWDEVSSIIPQTYDGELLDRLSPEIQFLKAEGFFRAVSPEDLIFKKDNWNELDRFQEEFKAKVSLPYFKKMIASSNHKFMLSTAKVSNRKSIHRNKTSDVLLDFLFESGLASISKSDSDWLKVESNTALLYMSLLAKYLADLDYNATSIGTDNPAYEKLNFSEPGKKGGLPVFSVSINDYLPTPNLDTSLQTILDFKQKRDANLINFRKLILEFEKNISQSESLGEVKDLSISFEEDLRLGVRDLEDVMKDSKIDFSLKSLKSLIDFKSPAFLATIGTALASRTSLLNIPSMVSVAGIAAVASIQVGVNYIDVRNTKRAEIRKSPFSYVYYAKKAGLLKWGA